MSNKTEVQKLRDAVNNEFTYGDRPSIDLQYKLAQIELLEQIANELKGLNEDFRTIGKVTEEN